MNNYFVILAAGKGKRFSKNKTSIKLIAENSAYEDIHVSEQTDFAIEGKAVGVIRESV